MSAFDTIEKSVQDATPVELYTIALPRGTYTLTSYDEDVSFGGILYAAVEGGLGRGNIHKTGIGKDRDVTILIPLAHTVAQLLLTYGIEQGSRVTIDRAYVSAGVKQRKWDGEIVAASSEEAHLQLKTKSTADLAMAIRLPMAVASRTCQHTLYDPNTCRASRGNGNYVVHTTVANVVGDVVTLASIGGRPDQWAQFGALVRSSDLRARDVYSQVGAVVTVDHPFATLAIGDVVELWKGCDGYPTTCRDEFYDAETGMISNIVNFGGHPDLPANNPLSPLGMGVRINPLDWLTNPSAHGGPV